MRAVKSKIEDIERLRPVALEWEEMCNGEMFGIETNVEVHLSDLAGLVERDDADLFILEKEKSVVGYIGITCFNSPVGRQKIAEEHYWYVSGKNRGRGTMELIRAVRQWARERGCSHIIFNASNLASNMHDRVCHFYEQIGFNRFETSYISKL